MKIKRYDNLFDRVANFETLYKAYEEAAKGRRYKKEVMETAARAEMIVSDLARELQTGIYKPGGYYEFEVRNEVKRRIIHAPLFRDRIVQHAVCDVLTPIYEKKFIFDSYANREGKGNHRAVRRVRRFLREAGPGSYVLQGDFAKYYDNVNHELLKHELRRTIKDTCLLAVCDSIVDSYNGDIGKGIPIGAPFSQLMANAHLDAFDHLMKDVLRIRRYVRLMDDFIIIGDKEELTKYLKEIRWFADTQLKQPLNRKTRIFPASHGVDFGGYRTFANRILPRKRNVKAAKIRLKTCCWLYSYGGITLADAKQQVMSFLGYMRHCSGKRTVRSVLENFVLRQRRQ